MRDHKRRFDALGRPLLVGALLVALLFEIAVPAVYPEGTRELSPLQSVDPDEVPKTRPSLYVDIFDQAFYEEGVQFLRLADLARKLTGAKVRARNVNVFEEVPDSLFFTNRHGRERLSKKELQEGPEGSSPAEGRSIVTRGKMEGVNPGFFIRDAEGREFLLKFDPIDYPEMASAAESISARIFHAIGYNIPTYHVARFNLEDMAVEAGAEYYDDTGFKTALTKDRVEELLLFVARERDDSYRASASEILRGEIKGPFPIDGHRKDDPNDLIPHRYLREIRALRVFSSWVDYYDVRSGNTLDAVEVVGGRKVLKHYIIDFGSTLGSAGIDPKPPQFGHEYVFDWGEFFKSLITFGFREKPWQKRWEENKRRVDRASVGYFDNRQFDPGRWKNQMPYHAFRDLTASDGYWAAKIILAFRDEDIEALVETGELSDASAREYLARTLAERRDLIGRYWLEKSCPLDWFKITRASSGYRLEATDLVSHYGLEKSGRRYRFAVHKTSFTGEKDTPSFLLDDASVTAFPDPFVLTLQATGAIGKWSKRVCLTLKKSAGRLDLVRIEREL